MGNDAEKSVLEQNAKGASSQTRSAANFDSARLAAALSRTPADAVIEIGVFHLMVMHSISGKVQNHPKRRIFGAWGN